MTTINPKKIYSMAVCLYPRLTTLDFQGPIELIGGLSIENLTAFASLFPSLPDCAVEIEYLSHSMDPVRPRIGPALVPTKTYRDMMDTNFDIIMVPGGPGDAATVNAIDASLFEFLKKQGPNAKHILTICTGSWLLARTGLLDGKRATTNKAVYRAVVEDTKNMNIQWVPKARWVVNDDKHIWTSSGVSAGQDLGVAFLQHLIGKELTELFRGVVEMSIREQGDDEFAEFYGLV